MSYPTRKTFLKLKKGKKGKNPTLIDNPIDVSKLTPKELKEYGLLLESETGKKKKGLTRGKGKGFMPSVSSRLSFRKAAGGGLVGRNKVMNGYKKGGQI
tara:strand:- start:240 stop:536 length:297 start_codon:yes stop_codon:yes gene_type:complete